ncbi:uncharacterized protein [Zea mays]|uniref:uncharacterized protein n=1 Tax=Zea mays TaxID=4577 RepID=UPI000C6C3992|nr:uncharacterized protein LOC111589790 [Zea mays]|eukprot:XP_023156471.1 uncharacterized protein LOC111589790 [Zea mays]
MALILRFVNNQGQVIEKFLGIEHVTDTSSSSLKQALDGARPGPLRISCTRNPPQQPACHWHLPPTASCFTRSSGLLAHTHNVGVTRTKLSLNSRVARIILFSIPLSSPSSRSATTPVDTARQGRASAHGVRPATTPSRGHGGGQPRPPVDLGSPVSCPPCPGRSVVRRAESPRKICDALVVAETVIHFRASRNRRSSFDDQMTQLFEFYKAEDSEHLFGEGCLWGNLCSGKEEGVEADPQEFQDFDEFED